MGINNQLLFRKAQPQDVERVVPLIYSAGPQAIDYLFQCHGKKSQDFLRFAFKNGNGFLGYKNHTVATMSGQVVGILAVYNLSAYARLTLGHLWLLRRFYPASNLYDLIARAVHMQSIMPAPGQKMHYVANFGVPETLQGSGIGRGLLDHQYKRARELGRALFALDVSVENPLAQAFYERYGFSVIAENQFSGPPGSVPNTRRMTMALKAE
jgi:ribosomal protein S18 acetylase RimI-like enzyme